MLNKFLKHIFPYENLEDLDLDYLKDHIEIKSYKKNERISCNDNYLQNIYYVLDGCVRLFYCIEGKDKTAFFYYEGNFIWADKGFSNLVLNQKNFEALEDTIVVQIDMRIVRNLRKQSPNFESIIRQSKEKEFWAYQQLATILITLSPEERFIELMKTNNILFQRAPQQHIATYLGVSAETLSRIKKRVYTKN